MHPSVSIFLQNDIIFQRYLGPLLGPLFIYWVTPPDKPIKEFIISNVTQFLGNAFYFINVTYNLPCLLTVSLFIASYMVKISESKIFLEYFFEIALL